ncbi:hypothetical protein RHECNPAF_470037 [Rhizobium etli CNPAF512]|nr:hypothetical protein RHECNPAF_470037 [Rhizobium etli CNPAF512]
MSPKREQEPQSVSDDQQSGQAEAERLGDWCDGRRVQSAKRRRHQQRDCGQEKQACLDAGARPVEFLNVIFQAAEQKRSAQHEQRVGDDRPGDRCLDQRVFAGLQGSQRNDQFGQVSKGRVQQPACGVTRLGGNGFGRMTEQSCQGHDGEHRQDEERRMSFWEERRSHEYHRHGGEQPEYRAVADLFEQVAQPSLPVIAWTA